MYASTTVVSSCCDKDKDNADQVSRLMNAHIFGFFPAYIMSGCLKVRYKHSSTYNEAHTLMICITGRLINGYSSISIILWTLASWLWMTKMAIETPCTVAYSCCCHINTWRREQYPRCVWHVSILGEIFFSSSLFIWLGSIGSAHGLQTTISAPINDNRLGTRVF